MAVLLKTEYYAIADGRRGKLSRETSSYPGRHGEGGSMRQDRIVWSGWIIRQKVGKFGLLG